MWERGGVVTALAKQTKVLLFISSLPGNQVIFQTARVCVLQPQRVRACYKPRHYLAFTAHFFFMFSLGLSAYKAGHWLVCQCAWYV